MQITLDEQIVQLVKNGSPKTGYKTEDSQFIIDCDHNDFIVLKNTRRFSNIIDESIYKKRVKTHYYALSKIKPKQMLFSMFYNHIQNIVDSFSPMPRNLISTDKIKKKLIKRGIVA